MPVARLPIGNILAFMEKTDPSESIQGRNRNVELKARLTNLDAAREIAKEIATEELGKLHQIDTYFKCRTGRLKLREVDGQSAQLIFYMRDNQEDSKLSDYCIVDVTEPDVLKRALGATAGICQVVEKTREVFLVDNVRIHLDEVKNLGSFLEFEAVLSNNHDQADGHQKVMALSEQFGLSASDLLAESYADMK